VDGVLEARLMVIEVVTWKGAKKHAINQDAPTFTLCGVWIRGDAEVLEGVDEFPDCLRCELSVMKS
jgi:hypothetical protein